jgi:hypothetical protein
MVGFESSLERDLLLLCEFDLNVARYEEQPVCIEYVDENGTSRTYTPDLLITYRSDIVPAKWMRPILGEVKYRADLKGDWPNLRRKFKAGRVFAQERGWEFRVLTETDLRTPLLDNARFLLPFRRQPRNAAHEELLLDWLHEFQQSDPETLLAACCRDPESRAGLIPTLWRLIADRRVWCDLSKPLTMRSTIWEVDAHLPDFAR